MTEKLSHESLPTPEKDIKNRLIAAAKEIARLGGVDQLGEPADGDHFIYGFKHGPFAYRILADQRADALPLALFVDKKLEGGGGLLAIHKRYEFDASGNVQCFVHDDSMQDLADFNKAAKVFIDSNDMDEAARAARVSRARMGQRKDQDEAAQRDMGMLPVGDETELAEILTVFEKELSILRARHQRREESHE